MKLNYKRTILVGFAFFLICAFWQAYDAIVPLVLTNHFGLPQFASGIVMSIDNVLAVFLLPLFGALSDKLMTKFGRRTPFIFIGTISAVVCFVLLTFIDGAQLKNLTDSGAIADLTNAKEIYNAIKEQYGAAAGTGDEAAMLIMENAEKALSAAKDAFQSAALDNLFPLIGFMALLLLTLISMAIFRSPAVALMPDVTVKPLRSKGNAIINLMGTAGGIIVLVFGMIFKTSSNLYMQYTGYVLAVCGIMIMALVVFILTVKEKKWAEEMEEQTASLGLEEPTVAETGEKRSLSKPELKSLILILASVALWYIGYNSITSKYSVYATDVLGFDFNFTLILAQAAAVVAYIPVGIIASKVGRKRTILAGIAMLGAAFLIGAFIEPTTPPAVMYPVFALAGIGWATINVNSFPMAVELARGGEVGKYTGYYYTASMAAQIIAPILAGGLYDLVDLVKENQGMRIVFFPFGVLFVALSFVTMSFVKHGDSKPVPQGALESLAGGEDD